jgi:ABC-type transporter Mla MlaB component
VVAVEGQDSGATSASAPFQVSGPVTFESFSELRAEGDRYIASVPHPVFNLAEVVEGSSVAVALLMAWFRHAHHIDRTVAFEDVPESLLNIIEVSGLADVLPVSAVPGAAEPRAEAPAEASAPPEPDRA